MQEIILSSQSYTHPTEGKNTLEQPKPQQNHANGVSNAVFGRPSAGSKENTCSTNEGKVNTCIARMSHVSVRTIRNEFVLRADGYLKREQMTESFVTPVYKNP